MASIQQMVATTFINLYYVYYILIYISILQILFPLLSFYIITCITICINSARIGSFERGKGSRKGSDGCGWKGSGGILPRQQWAGRLSSGASESRGPLAHPLPRPLQQPSPPPRLRFLPNSTPWPVTPWVNCLSLLKLCSGIIDTPFWSSTPFRAPEVYRVDNTDTHRV